LVLLARRKLLAVSFEVSHDISVRCDGCVEED